MYKLNSGSLDKAGDVLSTGDVISPYIFEYNGNPAVAYGSYNNSSTSAAVLENNKWKTVMSDTTGYSASNAAVADNGAVYMFSTYG